MVAIVLRTCLRSYLVFAALSDIARNDTSSLLMLGLQAEGGPSWQRPTSRVLGSSRAWTATAGAVASSALSRGGPKCSLPRQARRCWGRLPAQTQ